MVALLALILNSLMHCPLVSNKMVLWSCMILALPARVLDSCMYLLVSSNIWLLWYQMTTYITTVPCILCIYDVGMIQHSLFLDYCNSSRGKCFSFWFWWLTDDMIMYSEVQYGWNFRFPWGFSRKVTYYPLTSHPRETSVRANFSQILAKGRFDLWQVSPCHLPR